MSKNKLVIIIVMVLGQFFAATSPGYATTDSRALKLQNYLTQVGSPLVGQEELIIETAEKYELDWTLLAAIAGTESSFGKRMPHNCINPYGWGIYGDNKLCFADFAEAIAKVGEGIGTRYNTTSLETIGRTYNKANTAKWLANTRFFMNKIKSQAISAKQLPIEI
jgi:hypothetical protein